MAWCRKAPRATPDEMADYVEAAVTADAPGAIVWMPPNATQSQITLADHMIRIRRHWTLRELPYQLMADGIWREETQGG